MRSPQQLVAAIRRRVSSRAAAAPETLQPGAKLLEAARLCAEDPVRLREICARAKLEAPSDLWRLFEIGSVARDAGLAAVAEDIYAHILRVDADTPYAAIHYAKLLVARGADAEAVMALEAVTSPSIFDDYILAELAELLQRQGGERDAYARAEQIQAPDLRSETLARLDFARFCDAHPPPRVLADVEALEARPEYLTSAEVADRIQAALNGRQGFSLVRIGDGEGAFLRLSPEDEKLYPALYARNRADRARVWFAGELDIEASGFSEEMSGLDEVMRNATILGLPYAGWMENEQRVGSITGVSSLTNVVRWAKAEPPGRAITFQVINLHLELEGGLAELLHDLASVGLIACHPDLPERLARRFGIADIEFHKLPGEKGMRELIGNTAAEGTHYPDVFRRVLAALDRPLHGKLFLVAGGILGKFYCERIRASGGVALDIGAVADAWVGAVTRPSHDASRAL